MSTDDREATPARLATRPRPKRPEPVPCSCQDTVAIIIEVAGHLATLHLCQWCGDSWDIDGTPVPRQAVHRLVPKSDALSAIWRRHGSAKTAGRPRRCASGEQAPGGRGRW